MTTFRTDEEALALANQSEYGLVGAVYSRSIVARPRVANRIKAGMVHVNDGTLNDEATIPFGGSGTVRQRQPIRRRGEPRQLHRVAVGDGARRATDIPVLSASDMASITDVARLAGVSTATVSRVRPSAPYAVSPRRARVCSMPHGTLDYVPNALARGLHKSHIPVVGVIVHDITDPYFSEVVRGVEDAATPGGYLVITCSSDRNAERENSYVRLLRSMRAATLIFAGSGLDDPTINAEMRKHIAAMRGYGAAVVHLSPHASARRTSASTTRRASPAWSPSSSALGPPPDRLPRRPDDRCTSPARRLDGYRRGLAEADIPFDERLVVSTGFNREGGALGDRHAAGRGRAVHGRLRRQRSAGARRPGPAGRAGIDVPREVSVAGFDDIQTAAMASPRLSTVRLPLHEIGRRGFSFAERQLAGERPRQRGAPDRARHARLDRRPAGHAAAATARGRQRRAGDRRSRPMTGRLAGRVVLVTGSSRGIGAEVAVKAAAEGARSPSITTGRPRPPTGSWTGREAWGSSAGRSAPTSATAARPSDWSMRSSPTSGGSTGWSTTPGGRSSVRSSRPTRPIGTRSSATDLTAAFHTCRAALPSMVERGNGAIVNVASRLGQMGIAETAAYSAAKAGLIGLTRSLAREFGPRGVRVNAVAPGLTITEMTTDLADSDEGRRRLRDMPLGRFGRADEVADSVIFLLSDAASLYLGQTLNPNAGGYMP